ncbi:hypothetical protein H2200_009990 [Cladophialophora chaetospira]|uniref:DUF1212 domain membrane protein Prm10 n=1 Tax=Cladophialophora chaetospira TaxID=386627 RepID=A0AA39CEH6_9EURO|nr:hypothetical protein H2200_009990 [Cladophialophora chaetospira]
MAGANDQTPTTSSTDTSSFSTPSTTKQTNLGSRQHGQRQGPKVKFSSMSATEGHNESEETLLPERRRSDIPHIRLSNSEDVADHSLQDFTWTGKVDAAAAQAQDRASRLHDRLSNSLAHQRHQGGTHIPPRMTPQAFTSPNSSPPTRPLSDWPVRLDDIPLQPLDGKDVRPYTIDEDSTDEDDSDVGDSKGLKPSSENYQEAKQLLRTMTGGRFDDGWHHQQPRSGTETPAVDKRLHDLDYVPAPINYHPSPFGLIQNLTTRQQSGYGGPRLPNSPPLHEPHVDHHSGSNSRNGSESHDFSTTSSGRLTPKRPKWYDKEDPERQSSGSLSALLATSISSAAPALPTGASNYIPRPGFQRAKSSQSMIATAVDMIKHPTSYLNSKSKSSTFADEERVVSDLAEIIACRKYLKKLARTLMAVGAPTHRLEEYMKTSARALNIDCDCLYQPGSMLVSINDRFTMTTEVTLVRESGGVDLGKFKDVFEVYKLVIHGKYTAEEGTRDIDEIMSTRGAHPLALRIFAYGIAAISVGPFAFSARPVDFAPNFILGCILGSLQLILVPKSEQFAHVFEVLAAVIIAFVSRGLGSIYHNDTPVFCFSAIAQSSIALILPGYTVLCAALELQSKSLVSGSVRLVYAIIYSLFLGFGILIGSVLMGVALQQAQSDVTCPIPTWWNDSQDGVKLIYVRFIWVPIFAICLAIINQAKWGQMGIMTLIACVGYQFNFWISRKLANNIQVANAIGAFAIGTMANFYSRFFHGLAAAAMLPAIFVQVPSGLAASGSLVAGITSADQITGNATDVTVVNNGTAGFQNSANVYSGTIFNVGYGMVQVAIGISVGLYLSALIVYPFGKRSRSGLFSF